MADEWMEEDDLVEEKFQDQHTKQDLRAKLQHRMGTRFGEGEKQDY